MNPPSFFVLIPGRNTEKWVDLTLNSVITQEYPYFRTHWVDDASEDNGYERAKKFLEIDSHLTVTRNDERCGAAGNIFGNIHMHAGDDDIVVIVAGDGDQLYGNQVLSTLAKIYEDPNVWLTYGQMISTDGKTGWCKPYPDENFRAMSTLYFLSPMTFRAKLFKKIRREDLTLGYDFYPMAQDSAFGIPMLEMAGLERIRALDEILYVYNQNDQSDARTDSWLQSFCHWHVRQRPRYRQLANLEEEPTFAMMGDRCPTCKGFGVHYRGCTAVRKEITDEGKALILTPDLGQDLRTASYEVPVRRVGERLDLCVPFGKVIP